MAAFEGVKQTCTNFVGGEEIDKVQFNTPENKVPTAEFVTTDSKAGVESSLAKITKTQTKIVKMGNGPKFTGDQLTILEYAVYSSTTGKLLGASNFDGSNPASQVFDSKSSKLYCDAITGVPEGSIVAFATPSNEEDPEGSLFIFELKRVYLPRANGAEGSPASGLPQVVRDPATGRPGLIDPAFAKPNVFRSHVLVEGKGEVVKEGDTIVAHYTLWQWSDSIGGALESSWDSAPATLQIANGQVISAWVKGLTGVKVGSQVEIFATPKEAYGPSGNSSIGPNAYLLFVVDVLGINK
jgi:peptidylprolyl isomerase